MLAAYRHGWCKIFVSQSFASQIVEKCFLAELYMCEASCLETRHVPGQSPCEMTQDHRQPSLLPASTPTTPNVYHRTADNRPIRMRFTAVISYKPPPCGNGVDGQEQVLRTWLPLREGRVVMQKAR